MRAKMLPYLVGALIATGVIHTPALADDKAQPPQPTVSKELVPSLKAAQEALGAKNYQAVLDALNQAEAAKADRSTYENFLITEMRVVAYANLHDNADTIIQVEKELANPELPADVAAKRRITLAQLYYETKDWAKFLSFTDTLEKAGPLPAEFTGLRCNAAYLAKDWERASTLCKAAIDAATQAGTKPQEVIYEMYMDSFAQRKDYGGYVDGLALILPVYPSNDRWSDYLSFLRRRPGYSSALELDAYLLADKLGVIKDPNEYLDMADIASKSALYPVEAMAIEHATAKGMLNGNPNAAQMRKEAEKGIADDKRNIDKSVKETLRAKTGEPMVKLGDAYAGYGEYAKAIEMYNAGLAKGGLKEPDLVKLHLALAQYNAGQKDVGKQGLQALTSAPGGLGDLARGWLMYFAQQPA